MAAATCVPQCALVAITQLMDLCQQGDSQHSSAVQAQCVGRQQHSMIEALQPMELKMPAGIIAQQQLERHDATAQHSTARHSTAHTWGFPPIGL